MTWLAFTGLLNVLVCGGIACLILQAKTRTAVARSYGIFNLTVAAWATAYTVWQFMTTPATAYRALQWTLFFGMFPVIAFQGFIFSFEGMTPIRRVILKFCVVISGGFAWLNFNGYLFHSVSPRVATGLWGDPTPWLTSYITFWLIECVIGFTVFIKTVQRASPAARNRLYYVLIAFALGHFGGISAWPMWYGIRFPPPELNLLISVCLSLIAYAVIRYRVMDIRLAIQQTAIYSVASLCLIVLYVAGVTGLERKMEFAQGRPSIWESSLIAMGIALLFHPLRTFFQRWIDRHFPRESLDQDMLREATGRFVHEIKRPLVKMSLPAQLALAEVDQLAHNENIPPSALRSLRDRLTFIIEQSQDAAKKIEAIQELSGKTASERTWLDIGPLIRKVFADEEERLHRAGVRARLDIASEELCIQGNAPQLEIVVLNLLRNAVDAMRDMKSDRELLCVATSVHAGIRLTIEDNGPGIATEHLHRIFDPWFSTKGAQGMGIGLYLTRQIVEAHQGTIDVSAAASGGARFTIHFSK